MRHIAIWALLMTAACTASVPAAQFRNPATGAVVAACGPLVGLEKAVTEAAEGCSEAYKDAGWVRVSVQQAGN